MPIEIPTWFIPIKKIDYEAEVLQFVGHKRRFGKLELPPPYCCYYSILELFSSTFFTDPTTCGTTDVGKALLVLSEGRGALDMVVSSLWGDKTLDKAGQKFYNRHQKDIIAFYTEIVEWTLCLPAEGFDMLPAGGSNNKPFWFDAEYLSWIVATVAQQTNETTEKILWHTPFLTAGHLIAAYGKSNGTTGIERKPDKDIMKREFAAAAEREAKGELHPWQIKYPARYPASKAQIDARVEIIKDLENLKNAN